MPLGLFSGAWFVVLGAGILLWCASEVRLRRTLLAHGVQALARVLPGSGHGDAQLEIAEAAEPARAEGTGDPAPLLGFQVPGRGEVVVRPRGWTTVRRSTVLAVDSLVQVAYDPADPRRVVVDGVRQASADLLWTVIGVCFLSSGALLLADLLGAF